MQNTPLIILEAFLWSCFSKSMSQVHVQSLRSQECQEQTWHSRCLSSVLNTERRVPSPHLLAMQFLKQGRLVLALFARGTHWFKVSCLSTLIPGPSFRAASHPVIAQPVQVPGVTSALMQELAFSFTELHKISVSPFLHLPRSHWSIIHSSQFCFSVVH